MSSRSAKRRNRIRTVDCLIMMKRKMLTTNGSKTNKTIKQPRMVTKWAPAKKTAKRRKRRLAAATASPTQSAWNGANR